MRWVSSARRIREPVLSPFGPVSACGARRAVAVGGGGHRVLLARSRIRSAPTATMMKMPTNRSDSWELPAELGDSGGHGLHQQRAEQRAEHRAAAAHDRRAADDDGGDDGELLAGADRLVERRGALGDDEAGRQPDQQAGDQVGQQHAPLHPHPGQPGGVGVAADGVEVPAAGGVPQVPPGEPR